MDLLTWVVVGRKEEVEGKERKDDRADRDFRPSPRLAKRYRAERRIFSRRAWWDLIFILSSQWD